MDKPVSADLLEFILINSVWWIGTIKRNYLEGWPIETDSAREREGQTDKDRDWDRESQGNPFDQHSLMMMRVNEGWLLLSWDTKNRLNRLISYFALVTPLFSFHWIRDEAEL